MTLIFNFVGRQIMRRFLQVLLVFFATLAHADLPVPTLDFKAVKLTAGQRASLERLLASTSPTIAVDWNTLQAQSSSMAKGRRSLSVSLSSVPALTQAGVCRSEQRHFYIESGTGRWHADEDLTRFYAWVATGGDCALSSLPIGVDKSLPDADFLFIERQRQALQMRAKPVIGGSDCARVLHCEVTLRQISRVRQETPARVLTKLTFTPVQPGQSCLYVMEVSFVGALNDLVPLGASCPRP